MGGNVALTIRLEDGTEYRMDRWTAALEWIKNVGFLRGEKSSIDDALEHWLSMKADWEANKDTGDYEHNMTSVYAPYPYGCRPSGYGIVVVDFVNKVILSNQGYTALDQIIVTPMTDLDDGLDRFFETDAIKRIEEPAVIGTTKIHTFNTFQDFKQFVTNKNRCWVDLILDMSPFTLENFTEDEDGARAIYDRVIELGFELSDDEKRDWESWITGFNF